jgi:hypothetical protein
MTERTHRWSLQDGGAAGEQLATRGSRLRVPTMVKSWSGEPLALGLRQTVTPTRPHVHRGLGRARGGV